MGLDNPDLINRTVVRRRAASLTKGTEGGGMTTASFPPPFHNMRVTNAFKNKIDEFPTEDFHCIYIFALYQTRQF